MMHKVKSRMCNIFKFTQNSLVLIP